MKPARDYHSLPNSEAASLARASATELSQLLSAHPDTDQARIQLDGHELILPRQALALLRDLLSEMAQGHAVTVVTTHAELTTQQSADLLNVSRPYFVGLLEDKKIPFFKVGTHRRIRYEDLLAYQRQIKEQSKSFMDELAAQAQEHGMGY